MNLPIDSTPPQQDDYLLDAVTSEMTTHTRRDFLKLASTGLGALLLAGSSVAMPAVASARQWFGTTKVQQPLTNTTSVVPKDSIASGVFQFEPAPVQAMDFSAVFAKVEGFSAKQLQAHEGLYKGYVAKYKTITEAIKALPPEQLATANATYHPYRELLVEQSFALNGVLLHEAYFEGLGNSATSPSAALKQVLTHRFGSWDVFLAQLMAAAKCMRGWAILAVNLRDGGLHWYGLDTHHQYSPMLTVPILVVDVYEHAYMIDFVTNREAYINSLVRTLNWSVVEQRLTLALEQASVCSVKKR